MKPFIDEIYYVWHFSWPPFHRTLSASPSGHTLHCIVSGEYELKIKEKIYKLKPGDLIYYGSNEKHEYRGGKSSVDMYSVNFSSKKLSEMPLKNRVFSESQNLKDDFKNLYLGFHSCRNPVNTLNLFTVLGDILLYIFQKSGSTIVSGTGRWPEIEAYIKTHKKFRIKPSELASVMNISTSTLYRICINENGISPEKQIKKIRINEAKKLLLFSGMNISDTAYYLGYPRVHEFSREFTGATGTSPSTFKKIYSRKSANKNN